VLIYADDLGYGEPGFYALTLLPVGTYPVEASQTFDARGNLIAIYDPDTTRTESDGSCARRLPATASRSIVWIPWL
jgi:hypothetical protein